MNSWSIDMAGTTPNLPCNSQCLYDVLTVDGGYQAIFSVVCQLDCFLVSFELEQ